MLHWGPDDAAQGASRLPRFRDASGVRAGCVGLCPAWRGGTTTDGAPDSVAPCAGSPPCLRVLHVGMSQAVL